MSNNKDINLQMLHLYLDKSYLDKDKVTLIKTDCMLTCFQFIYKDYVGINYHSDSGVDLPTKELVALRYSQGAR